MESDIIIIFDQVAGTPNARNGAPQADTLQLSSSQIHTINIPYVNKVLV